MLRVQLPYITYHRILVDDTASVDMTSLKEDDYSFVVCYGSFDDTSYHTVAKNSCIIDLSKGLDECFGKFHPTSRNEVRRADKITELSFHQSINDFDFETYYAFHTACEHDRNWFPVPPEELKQSIVFSATYNGELIAGMSCYAHKNRIRVGRIFSNKRSKQSEVLTNLVYGVASKRIVYEICKYAASNNYISLDLGGVDLNDPTKAGITKFKLSLGGDVLPVTLARHTSKNFVEAENIIRANGWDLT